MQIEILNEVFSPRQTDVDRAHAILEAYRHATDVEATGAVVLDGEMIDEASRKLAQMTMEKARLFHIEPSS